MGAYLLVCACLCVFVRRMLWLQLPPLRIHLKRFYSDGNQLFGQVIQLVFQLNFTIPLWVCVKRSNCQTMTHFQNDWVIVWDFKQKQPHSDMMFTNSFISTTLFFLFFSSTHMQISCFPNNQLFYKADFAALHICVPASIAKTHLDGSLSQPMDTFR